MQISPLNVKIKISGDGRAGDKATYRVCVHLDHVHKDVMENMEVPIGEKQHRRAREPSPPEQVDLLGNGKDIVVKEERWLSEFERGEGSRSAAPQIGDLPMAAAGM